MANILLVDDDESFVNATADILTGLGHKVCTADCVEKAKTIANSAIFTHVILDLILPDGSGLHLLDKITEHNADVKIALVTGHASVKSAVANLYGPNIQYLLKPIFLDQLTQFLEKQTQPSTALPINCKRHFDCLVGESIAMHQLYEMIERVSSTQANVMLIGESGSGKEEVAKAIHHASKVSGKLVPVNCGAFATDLISSELFGHEKGSFTGAVNRKIGVFEQAQDGTLFLDEVTEMPIDLQPNLLRALESRKAVRVGGTTEIDINCRVISATNRSEYAIAQENKLREDLYFRLAVFPIHIPPLRARKDDIPLLVNYFLADFNQQYSANIEIREADLKRLCEYEWPGNVRELRHCLHRAYIMADQEQRCVRIPERLASPFAKKEESPDSGIAFGKTVEDVERELIMTTLEHLKGDKKRAAEILGISLKTLYNRLNTYEEQQS